MRILVTGSRSYKSDYKTNRYEFLHAISAQMEFGKQNTIIVGDCPTGADALAIDYYKGYKPRGSNLNLERFRADWDTYGKKAGPIRNQAMIDAKPDVCLAFPTTNSKGTWDCVRRAKAAGVPVIVYSQEA